MAPITEKVAPASPKKFKIAFIHPDLGIGGAERLVVDAAVGLQELKNEITIYTSHCDKSHCFEEVSSGVLNVEVFGDFLPTKVLGKFHILFAILRQLWLTIRLIQSGKIREYDYFIVDQLSFCVPLLQMHARSDAMVLFYCHFPDQLLAQKGSALKSLYRYPFDAIEEWTTGLSDRIVVNSNFTKLIFHKTFTRLGGINPGVIYPCVDTAEQDTTDADAEVSAFMKNARFFLSVNRFERKKDVGLAIKAFAKFREEYNAKNTDSTAPKPRLVIAGGFDLRVAENVEVLRELSALTELLSLQPITIRGALVVMPPATDVLFLPSIKSSVKTLLIKKCEILLYTPSFEHFGIVPVEGMLSQTPVLATNTGGPLESVVNYDFTAETLSTATGYIREPETSKWSEVLIKHFFTVSAADKQKLGANGLKRVNELFLRQEMSRAFLENLSLTTKGEKGAVYGVLLKVKIDYFVIVIAVSLAMRGNVFAYFFLFFRMLVLMTSQLV